MVLISLLEMSTPIISGCLEIPKAFDLQAITDIKYKSKRILAKNHKSLLCKYLTGFF